MDRAVRLPGLRALDRNFDRLPESLRWLVERLVHDPGKGAAPKPQLDPELRSRLERLLADDVARTRAPHGPLVRLVRLSEGGGGRHKLAPSRERCAATG